MPSAFQPVRRATPLAAVVRAQARRLLATFLAVGALAFVPLRAAGVDHRTLAAAAVDRGTATLLYARPLSEFRLRVQLATLVGLAAAGLAAAWLAREHDRVDLSRARGPLALAAVAAPLGLLGGYVVGVPLALDGLAAVGAVGPTVDPYWLGEFALGVAVAGAGLAGLPPLVVGAARAGAVSRFSTGHQRGLAALAVLSVAAFYSPPDVASFAVVAGLAFVGLGAGVAWLEFRG